ncbi:DEAD/DEAH box helicase [Candidatus Bathyarchaeota archaeon]|nr:DEAD/DEAH box helicase [Candidatus Bathyarchaeota archaeon]
MNQIKHFKDLPLSSTVMNGIEELGFSDLFPIQAQAIIPLLEGKDVIGQAQTGTGKTAAFGIPLVEHVDFANKKVQGLVLEPTRELAVQVAEHISRIGRYTPLKVLPIYGGASIQKQVDALKNGVHIVIGTPGRIIDHIKRGTLDLTGVKAVVLDEADRMLDMGFREDVEFILSQVPLNRQTSLFSATIDQNVMGLCDSYMKNPEKILVSKDEIALTQISQYYMLVNPKGKFQALHSILEENHIGRAIIFCKTREGASTLAKKLSQKSYNVKPLHGGFTQAQRDFILESFRKGKIRLLVATDVAARGLDIQGVTHIINYDVPLDALVYFHRIGRTARVGREGTAITLVSYSETAELKRIKALTKTTIKELENNIQTEFDEQPKKYMAVCAECGAECEIPFKPDPNRPVYCHECWEKQKSPIQRLA